MTLYKLNGLAIRPGSLRASPARSGYPGVLPLPLVGALVEEGMTGSARYVTGPWRYERIDGAGHWLQLDAPGTVNALLLDFLGQQGESAVSRSMVTSENS
jgi:hypothetical protein